MAISKETIAGLINTVQNLYLADEIPWMIGYSGGKDSSAVTQLVWMAIEQLPLERRHKQIHIMNTDTLVESPVVSKWVTRSLERMVQSAKEKQLPFHVVQLTPSPRDTFWVNLIGRGYPFPRMKYRWCTDRMKIRPVNQYIKEKIAEHGEVILVLGTRKAESTQRANRMEYYEKKRVRELLSPNPTLANELVFSPLESWSNDDVWAFLLQYKNPWGNSNMDLMTLYKGATEDNECPLMVDKSAPSCGKSRFGCWVCTMVEKDKSMHAMIRNDEEKQWMRPLLEFRDQFGDLDQDASRRSFRRMNGQLRGNHGRLYHGPYKKEVREEWLKKLLEIQKNIHETGPAEFRDLELIHMSELREIRRIWVLSKHEFDDSVPRIYEEVFGKPFEDPEWIDNGNFGHEEWAILESVCKELFPDEELALEMVSSLIDLENHASSFKGRKNLLGEMDKTIERTFYQNEVDATTYYYQQNSQKKAAEVKYDTNFLDEQDSEKDLSELFEGIMPEDEQMEQEGES